MFSIAASARLKQGAGDGVEAGLTPLDYMSPFSPKQLPFLIGGLAAVSLTTWLVLNRPDEVELRNPGADDAPASVSTGGAPPQERGKLLKGEGQPADLPGSWPQFRGADRDGINREPVRLARSWPGGAPQRLWSVALGEGYAGAAVHKGCVYLVDYDQEKEEEALRCLSLADGAEVWRFSYPLKIKRNHGMSRTVPAVNDEYVVALGSKCHVTCLRAATGQRVWAKDLVAEYGAEVPEWYAGQCPFIEGERVILAPGGKALLMAVALETGEVLWETPNPKAWAMTHSSVAPMQLAGRATYVYPAKRGVVGVSAEDGELLWESTDWKIGIATVPTPVPIDDSRVFFCGGYNAGALMMQLQTQGASLVPKTLFALKATDFGATQQTPILYQNHLFGVRPNGEMVCLALDGTIRWTSGASHKFGLAPFMIADGLLLALDDEGLLTLMEASPAAFKPLAQADVLQGHEAWAPMALAGGRLLVRDLTQMVCLDLRA